VRTKAEKNEMEE
jgi:oligopeptidase B